MKRFFLLALCGLSACAGPMQGPEVDLVQVAQPHPTPVTTPPIPQSIGPQTGHGQWKAWVPRQVQPSGDTVEGHWITFSLTPPPEERMEPAKTLPRAPKVHYGAKERAAQRLEMHLPVPQGQTPQQVLERLQQGIPSPTVLPVVPQGFTPQQVPVMPHLGVAPGGR